MKINRTFSIPVSTAMKLKTVSNQSALVGRAIEKYLRDQEDFSLGDTPLREVMASLQARKDCPEGIKALIQIEFDKKDTKSVQSKMKPPFRSLV